MKSYKLFTFNPNFSISAIRSSVVRFPSLPVFPCLRSSNSMIAPRASTCMLCKKSKRALASVNVEARGGSPLVEHRGFEPLTPHCQCDALPAALMPRVSIISYCYEKSKMRVEFFIHRIIPRVKRRNGGNNMS